MGPMYSYLRAEVASMPSTLVKSSTRYSVRLGTLLIVGYDKEGSEASVSGRAVEEARVRGAEVRRIRASSRGGTCVGCRGEGRQEG